MGAAGHLTGQPTPSVELLASTMIDLADTLVVDWDPLDFLHLLCARVTSMLAADAAVVRVADADKTLYLLAASAESARLMQLFADDVNEGPGVEAWRTGEPVAVADLSAAVTRWPLFTPRALDEDFKAALGIPMVLQGQSLGALLVLYASVQLFDKERIAFGRALAQIAAIGLLQGRRVQRSNEVVRELQWALHSRVLIEQAKGALAERSHIAVEQAFERMRQDARSRHASIRDVAQEVLDGYTPGEDGTSGP